MLCVYVCVVVWVGVMLTLTGEGVLSGGGCLCGCLSSNDVRPPLVVDTAAKWALAVGPAALLQHKERFPIPIVAAGTCAPSPLCPVHISLLLLF